MWFDTYTHTVPHAQHTNACHTAPAGFKDLRGVRSDDVMGVGGGNTHTRVCVVHAYVRAYSGGFPCTLLLCALEYWSLTSGYALTLLFSLWWARFLFRTQHAHRAAPMSI